MGRFEEVMKMKKMPKPPKGGSSSHPGGGEDPRIAEAANNALVAVIQSDLCFALKAIDAPTEVWASAKLFDVLWAAMFKNISQAEGGWNMKKNLEWAVTELPQILEDNRNLWEK